MNLVNLSPLEVGVTISMDKHGYEHILAVAKGTFTIESDGTCVLAKEQQPLVYADEYYGEPGISSVRYESDFAFHKPKMDVVLNGNAYAPSGRTTAFVDVTLELSTIRKTIRVFGDRVWECSLLGGYSLSRPKPFLSMPLVYERAFGGGDTSHENEKKHAFETLNLVGVGFYTRVHNGIAGKPLPNLEHPKKLIRHPIDKPLPMGFGFIARNWQPRCSYAGTYDQAWLDERFPFLPLDFDNRYFQGAPEDQICAHLQGGERVRLTNLTPEGLLEFRLPTNNILIKLFYAFEALVENLNPALDTIILEPHLRRCILVWRTLTRLKGKLTDIREVLIDNSSRS
jgi:hypothetical protein